MDEQTSDRSGCFPGCLYVLGLAAVTGVLLYVNGAMSLAVLRALSQSGPQWLRDPRAVQFLLFAMPVLLLVLQWMVFDLVLRVVRRR
ncbi:hypothetical protein [Roseimaritima sediminicola]|uniref:hypothetical protein n=1 Tax=Roseimaritima sediminicola TaxID=2662066 RepID=UPI00129856FB|nr:hypothetical protein [Roseimaritima sediminicola]